MMHFKVEVRALGGDLVAAYPHSPEDAVASLEEYLEDMLSHGYEFVSVSSVLSIYTFIFRVVAK